MPIVTITTNESVGDQGLLNAVMGAAIAAGLPDLHGATFRIGRLSLLSSSPDATRLSADRAIGLHAQLRDGSWLVMLNHLVTGGSGTIIVDEDTCAVSIHELAQSACVAAGWSTNEAIQLSDNYSSIDSQRICAALDCAAIPLLTNLADDAAMVLPALLIPAGVPQAEHMLVLAAVAMAERDMYAPPSRCGALVLGDTPIEDLPQSRHTVLSPALALARGALAWLINTACNRTRASTPEQISSIMRLLSWLPWAEERQRLLRLCRQSGVLPGPPPAWISDLSTARTLMEAMGDHRISSWRDIDSLGRPVARTVGDMALQQLAVLLGRDPRPVVGVDPSLPWTDALRSQTRMALLRSGAFTG